MEKEPKQVGINPFFAFIIVLICIAGFPIIDACILFMTKPDNLTKITANNETYHVEEYWIDNSNQLHFDEYWEYKCLHFKWLPVEKDVTITPAYTIEINR